MEEDGDAAGGGRAGGDRASGRPLASNGRGAEEVDNGTVGFLGLRLLPATESLDVLDAADAGGGAAVSRLPAALEDEAGVEEGAKEVRLVGAGAMLCLVREAGAVLNLDAATEGLAAGFGVGFGGGFGCSTTSMDGNGRMNMPCCSGH
jgi:hypothetical protein